MAAPHPDPLPAKSGERGKTAAALAALRRANSEDHIPRGLLAHAEALWLAGDAAGAGAHLREVEAIARRGPMPLFATHAALLRARIALAAGKLDDAARHRDAAAGLITAHGYQRAIPELAVLVAEIATATRASDLDHCLDLAVRGVAGEPYVDTRTERTIDGGWWGLLPRLDAVLPAGHPARARLLAARAAYDAERDAYLDSQGDTPRRSGRAHAEPGSAMTRGPTPSAPALPEAATPPRRGWWPFGRKH